MSDQLTFDLPYRSAMGRADFYVSEVNTAAVAALDAWRDWPLAKMLLIGPVGSGKTHLAHVFAAQTGARLLPAAGLAEDDLLPGAGEVARVIEDADRVAGCPAAEERLFHLHNACHAAGVAVLYTAREAPTRWGLGLPDLLSRMQQAGQVRLAAPDDALLAAVLIKLAQDRGIALPPSVLRYALPRLDRSLAAVGRFVAALDAETLARGERPGLKHARALLAGPEGDPDTQA
jgi:chromosomal replication initiation ATPase DnaA